jgi:hypothetical protein
MKMLSDTIVEEIRHVRETHAAQFNYDLDAIYADIKQREKDSQRHYVTLAPRRYSGRKLQSLPKGAIPTA